MRPRLRIRPSLTTSDVNYEAVRQFRQNSYGGDSNAIGEQARHTSPNLGSAAARIRSAPTRSKQARFQSQVDFDFEFEFRQRREPVDWRVIDELDLTEIVRNTDIAQLQRVVSQVTLGDIGSSDIRLLPARSIVKFMRAAQLMLEYSLTVQSHLAEQNNLLRKNAVCFDETKQEVLQLQNELAQERERLRRLNEQLRRVEFLRQQEQQERQKIEAAARRRSTRVSAQTPVLGRHTGTEDPIWPCPHCRSAFVSKHYLDKHIDRRHPQAKNTSEETQLKSETKPNDDKLIVETLERSFAKLTEALSLQQTLEVKGKPSTVTKEQLQSMRDSIESTVRDALKTQSDTMVHGQATQSNTLVRIEEQLSSMRGTLVSENQAMRAELASIRETLAQATSVVSNIRDASAFGPLRDETRTEGIETPVAVATMTASKSDEKELKAIHEVSSKLASLERSLLQKLDHVSSFLVEQGSDMRELKQEIARGNELMNEQVFVTAAKEDEVELSPSESRKSQETEVLVVEDDEQDESIEPVEHAEELKQLKQGGDLTDFQRRVDELESTLKDFKSSLQQPALSDVDSDEAQLRSSHPFKDTPYVRTRSPQKWRLDPGEYEKRRASTDLIAKKATAQDLRKLEEVVDESNYAKFRKNVRKSVKQLTQKRLGDDASSLDSTSESRVSLSRTLVSESPSVTETTETGHEATATRVSPCPAKSPSLETQLRASDKAPPPKEIKQMPRKRTTVDPITERRRRLAALLGDDSDANDEVELAPPPLQQKQRSSKPKSSQLFDSMVRPQTSRGVGDAAPGIHRPKTRRDDRLAKLSAIIHGATQGYDSEEDF